MNPIQSPRGTRDILPGQQPLWTHARNVASEVAEGLGFRPITVPTYEELALFQRSIGSGTDVMDKELFLVRGVRTEEGVDAYALRPEGTAGIVRSFIQHGMHTWPQPVKLFTFVNNFRYDRPQKGRYREHVQFDLEYFGDKGPFADAWIIYATWLFLSRLGLTNVLLKINTLGTSAERAAYVTALQAYFEPLKDRLSPNSRERLLTNTLRILDSKDREDRELLAGSPSLSESLSPESQTHFAQVQEYLAAWKIPFELDRNLVRGLDYYSHTAFEWTVTGQGGQQDSLGGGGRYDTLVTQLGGPEAGAVGAGIGMDRVIEEMERQGLGASLAATTPDAYIVAADSDGRKASLPVIAELLKSNIRLDANLSKEGMGGQLKAANRSGARYAVIIGQEEAGNGTATVKNLETGEQSSVKVTDLVTAVRSSVSPTPQAAFRRLPA